MMRTAQILMLLVLAAATCPRSAMADRLPGAPDRPPVAPIFVRIPGDSVANHGEGLVECPPACPWESFITYSHSTLSGERAPWRQGHLTIAHSFDGLRAAALEVIQASRFEAWDRAVALDSYVGLWDGSYANVRVQYAPSAEFLPHVETYGEVYQAMPRGWEASAGYRLRAYESERIHMFGGSIGRYAGSWYLRASGQAVPREGELGAGISVRARHYIEPPRAFVEISGGRGRGVEVIAAGPIIEMTSTYHASLRVQTYLSRHLGVSVQALYSDDHFFHRRALVIGLMSRW